MTRLVLDCSITMAWCFEDEGSPLADAVLEHLGVTDVLVPCIWPLEVGNVLVVAERRRRLTATASARFLSLLRALPISVDQEGSDRHLDAILALARQQALSAYDAAYLELALRQGCDFATQDNKLRRAAAALGIRLFAA